MDTSTNELSGAGDDEATKTEPTASSAGDDSVANMSSGEPAKMDIEPIPESTTTNTSGNLAPFSLCDRFKTRFPV